MLRSAQTSRKFVLQARCLLKAANTPNHQRVTRYASSEYDLGLSTCPRSFSSSSRSSTYVRFINMKDGKPQPGQNNPQDWRTWDTRVKVMVGGGALVLGYYLYHQEQVPDTGRWRFMNTSPEFEAKLGEELYRDLCQEFKHSRLPETSPITRHVRKVVTRILHASNLGHLQGEGTPTFISPFGIPVDSQDASWNPDSQYSGKADPSPLYGPNKVWNVIVVDNIKMVNAMAIPGTVVVFTGILGVCGDEEGLAAVLSHEIGHVVARHTGERISGQTLRYLTIGMLGYMLGIDFGISNTLSTFFMELPNSRTQEKEADLIGLRLMSRACYDPAAAPQVFARLAALESKIASKINFDFLRTHPSSESRVKLLQEALPQGYAIMAQNPECQHVREEMEQMMATAKAIRPGKRGLADWRYA